ncbi:unnamed protein product [Discosporangium mesarthrocarpum]
MLCTSCRGASRHVPDEGHFLRRLSKSTSDGVMLQTNLHRRNAPGTNPLQTVRFKRIQIYFKQTRIDVTYLKLTYVKLYTSNGHTSKQYTSK